jgi:glycosyltransferase involved in cell wall biosynthesis
MRVVITCPGLGIATRGFERFARDCFTALRGRADVDVTLIRGRGPSGPAERTVPTLSRDTRVARSVGYRTGHDDFWLEQLSFAATVQPTLARLQPEVVLLSEWTLAAALGALRRLTRGRFRIVLSNSAPGPPPYPAGVDHVLHPVPSLRDLALGRGEPPSRHTLLPLGIDLPEHWRPPTAEERAILRRRLGLPVDREVVLSVGVLSAAHKRMDYVIREVAALPRPRPFLALVGAHAEDTPQMLDLAAAMLGPGCLIAPDVPPSAVADYYRAADAFVLASMSEGFGLALVEALGHGLPVLAHDYDVPRFVLGEHGRFDDLHRPGALATLVAGLGEDDSVAALGHARHRAAWERFSWDVLAPGYVEVLSAASGR